jgi:hypothetical protein
MRRKHREKRLEARCWELTLAILALCEAEIMRIMV